MSCQVGIEVEKFVGAMNLSICLIVRDVGHPLEIALSSLREYLLKPGDELLVLDTGNADQETLRIAYEHKARVISKKLTEDFEPLVKKFCPDLLPQYFASNLTRGCITNFAAARQLATDLAKHRYQCWLDGDDAYIDARPWQTRVILEHRFLKEKKPTVFADYILSADKTILKNRFFDREKALWIHRVHETLDYGQKELLVETNYPKCVVKHRSKFLEGVETNQLRNYVLMKLMLEEGNPMDARLAHHMARALNSFNKKEEAIKLLEAHARNVPFKDPNAFLAENVWARNCMELLNEYQKL